MKMRRTSELIEEQNEVSRKSFCENGGTFTELTPGELQYAHSGSCDRANENPDASSHA